jgi:bifunctional non-homologous end joining protein LigD
MTADLAAGRRRIQISSADRVLIPDVGLTKLDLARHYADVAEAMLPHVRERPLTLHSFPAGIAEGGYFVKDAPRHFPK